jgi:hypothetical protein
MSQRRKGRRKRSGAQRRAAKASNKARRNRNGATEKLTAKQEKDKELKEAVREYEDKLAKKIVWM